MERLAAPWHGRLRRLCFGQIRRQCLAGVALNGRAGKVAFMGAKRDPEPIAE